MTSRRVFGQVEGTHFLKQVEWEIPDILSSSTDAEKFCNSEFFSFAGERWHLRLYVASARSFVSAYLRKETSQSECMVNFMLGLKRADGSIEKRTKEYSRVFPASAKGFGCSRIIEKSELLLRGSQLMPLGVLTVTCTLKRGLPHSIPEKIKSTAASHSEVKEEYVTSVEAATQTEAKYCIDQLSSDLNKLLLDGDNSDLTINVRGHKFRVHSGILSARVPLFHSTLKQQIKEKDASIVPIAYCKPNEFQAFLQFVYSGRTDNLSTDTLFGLYTLAEKFQVNELKSMCLDFAESMLSVYSFCDIFTLAFTHNKTELLQRATDYFSENMVEILQTVKWRNFLKVHAEKANELTLKALLKAQKR